MKHDEIHISKEMLKKWSLLAIAISIPMSLVFLTFPQLDIYISSLFYLGTPYRFQLAEWQVAVFIRHALVWFFTFSGIVIVSAIIWAYFKSQNPANISGKKWIYLAACLVIGPGFITNLILKDQWGRARPVHIQTFGGKMVFTPPLIMSDQCKRNCSFVSGESSSIFMLFFAFGFVMAPAFKKYFILSLVFGGLAGLIRIGAGGHFTSDVIFSGIFMFLTATILYWLFFYSRWSHLVPVSKPNT